MSVVVRQSTMYLFVTIRIKPSALTIALPAELLPAHSQYEPKEDPYRHVPSPVGPTKAIFGGSALGGTRVSPAFFSMFCRIVLLYECFFSTLCASPTRFVAVAVLCLSPGSQAAWIGDDSSLTS